MARRISLFVIAVFSLSVFVGCTSMNPASEAIQSLAPQTYASEWQDSQEHVLIDVRTPQEYNSGHIAGAVNIPLQELSSRQSEIPQDTPVVLYCRTGNRSGQAATMLADAGYSNLYNLGGTVQWTGAGYPLQ
jgi:rhodanese-related sulfurtransferase